MYQNTLATDWHNSFGKKSCRKINSPHVHILNSVDAIILEGSSTATSIGVQGDYAYITANSGSTTEADFYVINIANPVHPVLVSKIDTGPGLVGLALAGYMAYGANTSVNSALQGIDISDPSHPYVTWSFKIPNSHGTTTAISRAVVTNGLTIFIGTEKSTLSELYAVDATTHLLESTAEIGSGINGLYIDHSSVYVASPANPKLQVFSFNQNKILSPLSSYDPSGALGNGKSLDVFNETVFLGRTVGGNELMTLQAPTSTAASVPSSPMTLEKDAKISATIDGMIASKDVLYILTSSVGKEFQVWSYSPLPSPTLSSIQTVALPKRAVGLACGDRYIFVALASNQPLLVLVPEDLFTP